MEGKRERKSSQGSYGRQSISRKKLQKEAPQQPHFKFQPAKSPTLWKMALAPICQESHKEWEEKLLAAEVVVCAEDDATRLEASMCKIFLVFVPYGKRVRSFWRNQSMHICFFLLDQHTNFQSPPPILI